VKVQENFKKGAVELVVLHLLSDCDMYGYQLVQELLKRSDNQFVIREGTLYPSLYRMIEKGYITGKSELVGKKRTRIYYHIEASGLEALEAMVEGYRTISNGIEKVLASKCDCEA